MPTIEERKPTSLGELLDFIEAYQDEREIVWYRGVSDVAYSLTPSIARSKAIKNEADVDLLEKNIASTFQQRSPPFLDRELGNEWKTIFFMQHYGIPTRLLDWSESPFVSLYFALSNVERDKRGNPRKDAALWLCDPVKWNRTSLSHISFQGGILDEGCEELKAYDPKTTLDQKAMQPIMIYGVHNSPRIVAQRGVFALFGKSMKGMERVYEEGDFSEKTLVRLVISKTNIDKLLNSLFQKGFSESTIFPDLAGLALEIRRRHGFS